MLSNDWTQVDAFVNMGEDDESVYAKRTGDTVMFSYAAFGGLKLIEVNNIAEVIDVPDGEADYSKVMQQCGDDWEFATHIIKDGATAIMVVDSNSSVTLIPDGSSVFTQDNTPTVVSAEEYDAETMDELAEVEEELVNYYGF